MDTQLIARLFPRMESVNECDWLPAARRGERWALERFYHAYQPQVFSLCHRMLGRTEDAEDAMQAAFVQAFRALPEFRGESRAKTWLYRIAVNEALTLLRKRQRTHDRLEDTFSIPDGSSEVQTRLAVSAALARVRPEQRAILVLRYWEDLSYEEIASILAVSVPAVKMRLNRAREEFRAVYEEKS